MHVIAVLLSSMREMLYIHLNLSDADPAEEERIATVVKQRKSRLVRAHACWIGMAFAGDTRDIVSRCSLELLNALISDGYTRGQESVMSFFDFSMDSTHVAHDPSSSSSMGGRSSSKNVLVLK